MRILSLLRFFVVCLVLSPGFVVRAGLLPLQGKDIVSGREQSLDAPSQAGLVVVFLSSLCPCSNSHIPVLKKLNHDFPDFRFVGVHSNMNEAPQESRDYFKKAQLPFPVLQDTQAKIADRFKAYKTPHAFILSPAGTILYQGGVTDSANAAEAHEMYLREALQDIQEKRPIRRPRTRTLGCVISREGQDGWD